MFKCDTLELIILRINYNTTLLNKINNVAAPVLNIQPQNTEFKQEQNLMFSLQLKSTKQCSQLRHRVDCKVSGFFLGVHEVFALLRCYAAWVGSLLPTFLDSQSVPSSRVEQSSCRIACPFKMGMIGCPATSVTIYQQAMSNIAQE